MVYYAPTHCRNTFGILVNYMFLLFINFYRGMGLLTAAEQKRFQLETATSDDEDTLGGNEVAGE